MLQSLHQTYQTCTKWAEHITPTQRLPDEDKVSFYAKQFFQGLLNVVIAGSILTSVVLPLQASLTPLAALVVGAVFGSVMAIKMGKEMIPMMALNSFAGVAMITMPKLTLPGIAVAMMAYKLKAQLPEYSDTYTIGKQDQNLELTELQAELQVIANSKRQIKTLVLENSSSTSYDMTPSMMDSLKAIQPEKIQLKNVSFYEDDLVDLNRFINKGQVPQNTSFKFYYEADERKALILERVPVSGTRVAVIIKGDTFDSIIAYAKQYQAALDGHFDQRPYSVFRAECSSLHTSEDRSRLREELKKIFMTQTVVLNAD